MGLWSDPCQGCSRTFPLFGCDPSMVQVFICCPHPCLCWCIFFLSPKTGTLSPQTAFHAQFPTHLHALLIILKSTNRLFQQWCSSAFTHLGISPGIQPHSALTAAFLVQYDFHLWQLQENFFTVQHPLTCYSSGSISGVAQ